MDFLARGPGYGLFLTPREAVLSLSKAAPERGRAERHRSAVLRMRLAGANPRPRPAGVDRLPGATNYLRGGDSGSSETGVPGFAKVRYGDVYPGVDLLYHGGQGRFEYDFTVVPGADPGRIALDFSGQRRLALDRHGDLLLNTGAGTIRHRKPFAYQEAAGTRRPVPARFVLRSGGTVGFRVGAYDRTRPLTIDPVVVYATYLGGISNDLGLAVAADGAGNAYVTGTTYSPNFPTAGPIRGAPNLETDAFVAKLTPSGSLVYSTYLGGAGDDTGADIAVDAAGAAFVAGRTGSTDFPTTSGAADTSCGATSPCGDAFLAKLVPSGAGLTYSTYVGGGGAEAADGVAVDASGAAYVGGSTSSTDFPTQNPFQATYGGGASDGFVTKVDAAGSALVYSTYLGGSGAQFESVTGLEVDSSGSAYAIGNTGSPDFATTAGAFDTSCGTDGACDGDKPDAFVTKLSAGGAALDYSTFLGTAGFDGGYAIAVGQEGPDAGRAYVLGTAGADLQTTAGAYDRSSGGGFVARLNASGSGLEYSTFLGGPTLSNGDDNKPGIAVDPAGSAYVSGATGDQAAPPQLRPVAESGPGGFAAKLDSDGSGFAWSTFLGGAGSGMALDPAGAAYVTGNTGATDFPTQNPLQRKRSNGDQFSILDGFVVKLAPDDPQAPYVTGVTPEGDDAAGGRAVRITGTGFAGASAVAFGGVAAARFDVVSPTEIEAIAPPHGESDLRVTVTSAGRSSPPNPIARFIYAEGRWANTDALPGDRAGSATLLRDGKVLFLSGTTARLYDPLTGTWTPTQGPTLAGTPTLLPSGKVLVHAGAKAVRYDPATGASTATRGAPKTSGGAGTLLASGEILVVGGETAELYDPATDSFRLTGGPTFSSPDTVTRLKNGKVLVAGGGGRAELYDPATGAFSETGRLNIGRGQSTATLLPSGKVLVAGGFAGGTAQETAELYDPATGAWKLTRSLDQGRYGHAATLLPNGKVLIAGGVAPYAAIDAAELHDPALGGGNGSFKPAGRTEASYSRPTATVLSSDPNGFASDAGVCGSNCGKALVVGSSTTGAASLYTPRALPAPAAAPPGAAPPPSAGATPPPSAGATPPPPADPTSPPSRAATLAGCPARTANAIRGTARGDAIVGTPRGDRVFSLAGPDTVDGRAGDDCIDLGAGSDRGVGGVGDDLMLGGTGGDRLSGGRGRDRIRGVAGDDLLRGNAGGDHLTGGAGRDSIAGGAGNDRIQARDGQRDRIACGSGADTVIADRTDRVARDCERVRRS